MVAEPTDRIVLNAVNMTVDTAAIEGDDGLARADHRATRRPRR